MLVFIRRLDGPGLAEPLLPMPIVVLDHDQRRRSRQRLSMPDGTVVGIALPRGSVLRNGDILATEQDQLIQVQAAVELLSVVASSDLLSLVRAAYHLGNRHAALQLGGGYLCYPHDPVLDQLCLKLGLSVSFERRMFEPEMLAQSGHDHSHEELPGHLHLNAASVPRSELD